MTEKAEKTEKNQAAREAIGVRKLRFANPTDLPGKSVADGLAAHEITRLFDEKGKRTPQFGYLIEFRPWMRSFVITHHPAGGNMPAVHVYVPESNVTVWEAL